MAEFLTTKGTSYHIEKIIMEAKSQLVLISPYLQLSKTFYERLKDASTNGVVIKIIYGKDELKPNERNSLAELKNVELFYFENLHAKCYLNERRMVITSMNMYEFSEVNNREMGVLIDKNDDKEVFDSAVNETLSILKSAEVIPLRKTDRATIQNNKQTDSKSSKYKKEIRGYCIHCQTRIEYDPNRPYCNECYSNWARYGNPEYQESVCHRCGQYEATSMNKPQDYKCYSIWQKEIQKSM
jgi:phosphatidylserine/phosphatidylglycerophosphate/cardiolipin synthase-like enzyme